MIPLMQVPASHTFTVNGSDKWERIAELVASDAGNGSWFGMIVSIFENTIAIMMTMARLP
jgi:hypothetical protein